MTILGIPLTTTITSTGILRNIIRPTIRAPTNCGRLNPQHPSCLFPIISSMQGVFHPVSYYFQLVSIDASARTLTVSSSQDNSGMTVHSLANPSRLRNLALLLRYLLPPILTISLHLLVHHSHDLSQISSRLGFCFSILVN